MRFLVRLILAFAALAGTAQAQNPGNNVLWKRVGSWSIWIEPGGTCFVFTRARTVTMQLGYVDDGELYLILYNEDWKSLEPNKDYAMALYIDNQQHATTLSARRETDGRVYLRHRWREPAAVQRLLQDFQRGSQLTALYEGRQVVAHVLQASQPAIDELQRCQAAQKKSIPPGDDPFKRSPTGTAADKAAPPAPRGTAPPAAKLTAEQRLAAVRLMANLMTKMPGFRILGEDEQKALNAQLASLDVAVVWSAQGALGTLLVFPDRGDADVPATVLSLITGTEQICKGQYTVTAASDVRAANVRRVHFTCLVDGTEIMQRYVVMPFGKDGVYVFGSVGAIQDKDAIMRAEDLLRNALFEVVKR